MSLIWWDQLQTSTNDQLLHFIPSLISSLNCIAIVDIDIIFPNKSSISILKLLRHLWHITVGEKWAVRPNTFYMLLQVTVTPNSKCTSSSTIGQPIDNLIWFDFSHDTFLLLLVSLLLAPLAPLLILILILLRFIKLIYNVGNNYFISFEFHTVTIANSSGVNSASLIIVWGYYWCWLMNWFDF